MITASTKYHGITHLYTGETYIKDICRTYCSQKYLREELECETYAYLNEMPEEKFLFLFNSKAIRWYIAGLIKNQVRSVTSKFYRTHLRPQIIEDEFEAKHQTKYAYTYTEKGEMLNIIEEAVDTLDFYPKEMFKMYYYDNLSYQQISDYTASKNPQLRIPKTSIYHAVINAREEVINYLQNNYPDAFCNDLDSIFKNK